MTKASKPLQSDMPVIVNSMAAPMVFADGSLGLIESQGNIRITLAALHADHSGSGGPPAHVVNLRLVLPTEGAEKLAEDLLRYIGSLKEASKAMKAIAQPPAAGLH